MNPAVEREKQCKGCYEPFPATDEFFWRSKRTHDGLATRCKACSMDTRYYRRRARLRPTNKEGA
jgi:RNase P subunit RPR2